VTAAAGVVGVADGRPDCPVCIRPTAAACVWHGSPGCACVVRCARCGHRFRPAPATAWVDASVYDADYHAHRKTAGRPGFAEKLRTAHLHLDLLAAARGGRLGGARLLDVGCATGDFVVEARERGVVAHGVDVAADAVAVARSRNLPVEQGRVEEVAGGPFDVVHASHVLEHVPDVRAFVRAVVRLLVPGGSVVLEVPNEFDEAITVLRRAGGRRAPARLDAPHLHYFTTTSLRHLLVGAGLRVRRVVTYSHLRGVEPALGAVARFRYVGVPNLVLRVADRVGYGRNLVVVAERER